MTEDVVDVVRKRWEKRMTSSSLGFDEKIALDQILRILADQLGCPGKGIIRPALWVKRKHDLIR